MRTVDTRALKERGLTVSIPTTPGPFDGTGDGNIHANEVDGFAVP